MTTLGFSQARWTREFRIWGAVLQAISRIENLKNSFELLRSVVSEEFESSGKNQLSDWNFLNTVIIGANTDKDGYIFGTLTVASPNISVQLYSDSAKTALTASGVGSSGTTLTLTEKNTSGLIGVTVDIGAGSPLVSDSNLRLRITNDANKIIADVINKYGNVPSEEQNNLEAKLKNLFKLTTADRSLQSVLNAMITAYQDEFLFGGDRAVSYLADIMDMPAEVTGSGIIQYNHEDNKPNTNDRTVTSKNGVLNQVSQNMKDETGLVQTIKKNTVTSAALASSTGNIGQLALSDIALSEHCLTGTINIRCVDDTFPDERFSVQNVLARANPNGDKAINGTADAQIDATFEEGRMGFKADFDRVITETGDGNSVFSGYIITGESAANTNDGLLYVSLVTAAVPATYKWDMKVYRDAALAAGDLVASISIASGTGPVFLTLTEQNGSGLVFGCTFNKTNANGASLPYNGTIVNLNPCKEGDTFTLAITNNEQGKFQTQLARLHGASINSGASPTIEDSFADSFPVQRRGEN